MWSSYWFKFVCCYINSLSSVVINEGEKVRLYS